MSVGTEQWDWLCGSSDTTAPPLASSPLAQQAFCADSSYYSQNKRHNRWISFFVSALFLSLFFFFRGDADGRVTPFEMHKRLDGKTPHSLCNFLSCLLLTSTSSFRSLSAFCILHAAIGPVEMNTSKPRAVIFFYCSRVLSLCSSLSININSHCTFLHHCFLLDPPGSKPFLGLSATPSACLKEGWCMLGSTMSVMPVIQYWAKQQRY